MCHVQMWLDEEAMRLNYLTLSIRVIMLHRRLDYFDQSYELMLRNFKKEGF